MDSTQLGKVRMRPVWRNDCSVEKGEVLRGVRGTLEPSPVTMGGVFCFKQKGNVARSTKCSKRVVLGCGEDSGQAGDRLKMGEGD